MTTVAQLDKLIPANPTRVVELNPVNNEPAVTYTLGDDGVVICTAPPPMEEMIDGVYSVIDIVDGKAVPDERMVMPNEGVRFLRALYLSQFFTASRVVIQIF